MYETSPHFLEVGDRPTSLESVEVYSRTCITWWEGRSWIGSIAVNWFVTYTQWGNICKRWKKWRLFNMSYLKIQKFGQFSLFQPLSPLALIEIKDTLHIRRLLLQNLTLPNLDSISHLNCAYIIDNTCSLLLKCISKNT